MKMDPSQDKTREAATSLSVEPRALRILREFEPVSRALSHSRADAIIELGEARIPFLIEYKSRVSPAEAWQTVRQLDQYALDLEPGHVQPLVVADSTTAEARRVLVEHGISYVDALGNAEIDVPGFFIYVRASSDPRRQSVKTSRDPDLTPRLTGKASVVAQALMLDPTADWKVTDLAKSAGVSAALAQNVLARLERLGIVESFGSGPTSFRKLTNPSALLDLWVEEAHDFGVNSIRLSRFARSSSELAADVASELTRLDVDHALTGAEAAARLAPFITSVAVTSFWVAADVSLDELGESLDSRTVARGSNLMLRQARDDSPLSFAQQRDGVNLANTFRVYRDVQEDPRRGKEQAEHLRREVIGF